MQDFTLISCNSAKKDTFMDKNNSLPLPNRRKENFCQFYAGEYWGNPCAALRAAGYLLSGRKAVDFAETLFDDPEIRARIVHLRNRRSERTLADEAWIKELLIEIATNALKDSDRIRALASLAKIIHEGGSVRNSRKKWEQESDFPAFAQPLLPGFEGPLDGENFFDETQTAELLSGTD